LYSARTPEAIDAGIDRLLLLQGLSFFMGGLPLLYMGDELGLANTTQEELTSRKGPDGRELHRPYWNEDKANSRHVKGSIESRIFSKIQQMAQLRKTQAAFKGDADVTLLPNAHPQVLGLQRNHDLIGLFNFSNTTIDLKFSESASSVRLSAYQFKWLNIANDVAPTVLID
jgi:amylosucrase